MHNNKLERRQENGAIIVSEQKRLKLLACLVSFQRETRELEPESLTWWTEELSRYPLEDVQTAMRRFLCRATRDERNQVGLADLLRELEPLAGERRRQREVEAEAAERERYCAEYEAQTEADREETKQILDELNKNFAAKFRVKRIPVLPPNWAETDEAERERQRKRWERINAPAVVPLAFRPEKESELINAKVKQHRASCNDAACPCREKEDTQR